MISLPASLLLELAAHRKAQIAERLAAPYWEDHGLVFATEWGAPIDQRRDWAEFKQLLTAAGLRDARVHDLRHSAATLMLEADTDLQTAGQILGHGSITQTSQYTHILADRRRAAAARIESLLWGQPASEAVRASTATGDELLPELLPGVSARSTRPTRTPKTRGLRGGQGQDRTVDLPLFRRRRGVPKRRGTS